MSSNSGAGALDKRITIQAQTKTPDGQGGFTTAWTDIATIWAAIWPVSANETVQAAQPVMIISHRIRIRWRSIMRPTWRLKFGARYFNIVSIICPNEGREWLDIMCKESAS